VVVVEAANRTERFKARATPTSRRFGLAEDRQWLVAAAVRAALVFIEEGGVGRVFSLDEEPFISATVVECSLSSPLKFPAAALESSAFSLLDVWREGGKEDHEEK